MKLKRLRDDGRTHLRLVIEQPYCVACGCTEFTPCETPSGPCGWSVRCINGRGMCSRCADFYKAHGKDPRRIVTATRFVLEQDPRVEKAIVSVSRSKQPARRMNK